MIEDIFSREIIIWEVHAGELTDHASALISRACLGKAYAVANRPCTPTKVAQ